MFKLLKKIISINFFLTLKKKIYPYYRGLIIFLSLKKSNFHIFVPKYNKLDETDLNLANKIFESFKKMKNQQIVVSKIYKPSSLWQNHIDKDFKDLIISVKNNDLNQFLFFLQNFGNWHNYLGIENHLLIKKYAKNIFLKSFLKEDIFNGQKKLWLHFNKGKNLSQLNMPRFGNQNGAYIEDNFVVIGSFFNEIYSNIIDKYLTNNLNNLFIDLGGGYGKLAYYILKKNSKYNFIDLDIPEILILANYYLAKSFPNKKIFFYGKEEFNSETINKHDLVFLPNWEISNIPDNSVCMTINRNSLGEMDPNTAKNYIDHIHRISKYFFSMNHEYFKNKFESGEYSLTNKEFNIDLKFNELVRYPDLGHLTYETNQINLDSEIFFYLYQKK